VRLRPGDAFFADVGGGCESSVFDEGGGAGGASGVVERHVLDAAELSGVRGPRVGLSAAVLSEYVKKKPPVFIKFTMIVNKKIRNVHKKIHNSVFARKVQEIARNKFNLLNKYLIK
jgi:hypothetical protein